LPPLEAYKLVPSLVDKGGNTKEFPDSRKQHHGWNNITEFELSKIAELKDYLEDKLKEEIPAYITDREVMKFGQSNGWNLQKAGTALQKHFAWRNQYTIDIKLNEEALKMI